MRCIKEQLHNGDRKGYPVSPYHRNLRKKLRWFTLNERHYYCLAYCEQHGYLKGKIRIRRSEDKKLYIVKTVKLISPEEAEALRESNRHARKLRRGF